jgi:hypothetical protein
VLAPPGVASATPAFGADESPIPAATQAQLFLNVLSFDRSLSERAGAELVVAVLLQRRYRASLDSGNDMLAAFAEAARGNLLSMPVRVIAIELLPELDLGAELARLEVEVVYVTPLRALSIDDISAATRELDVRSLTAVPEALNAGLAVGLGIRDGRPEVLIHLAAARAEGADFGAQLLRMARIVE